MYDPEAPSSKLAIAELTKPSVSAQLILIAKWSTKSVADAEDLVEDALVRVLDPADAPWEPERRTFLTHMSFVIRKVWYLDRRRISARREVLDDGLARDEKTLSQEPHPDDEVHRRRTLATHQMLGERVLLLIRDDVVAQRVFELGKQDVLEPLEVAAQVPCTPDEARAAYKRLAYYGRKALDEWNTSEELRMKGLRAKAESPTNQEKAS